MSFLIDTDVCSAHLKNDRRATSRFMQYSGRLHVSAITAGELYTWALRESAPARHLDGLLAFLSDVVVLDFNHKDAQVFGAVRAQLFDRGVVIPSADSLIAATALAHDLALVTHNVKHFANIPGLNVIDWLD